MERNNLNKSIKYTLKNGIKWLVSQQNCDGSWGSENPITTTALAILILEEEAEKYGCEPLDSCYRYFPEIIKGYKYIFSKADTNGFGIYFDDLGCKSMPTGAVLAAISASKCSCYRVDFNINSPVYGKTFCEIAQLIVKYIADAQCEDGAWSFDCDCETGLSYDCQSDNFVSGFILLGLTLAKHFGICIPNSILYNLKEWVKYIQNENGGSGDTNPYDCITILNTSNLIHEMYTLGYSPNNIDLKRALLYIADNWDESAGYCLPGWNASPAANYQSTFFTMIALDLYDIKALKNSCRYIINWYSSMADVILLQQQCDGSWPASRINFEQNDPVFSSVMAMLTLQYNIICN